MLILGYFLAKFVLILLGDCFQLSYCRVRVITTSLLINDFLKADILNFFHSLLKESTQCLSCLKYLLILLHVPECLVPNVAHIYDELY
jgi:hypothetical protein